VVAVVLGVQVVEVLEDQVVVVVEEVVEVVVVVVGMVGVTGGRDGLLVDLQDMVALQAHLVMGEMEDLLVLVAVHLLEEVLVEVVLEVDADQFQDSSAELSPISSALMCHANSAEVFHVRNVEVLPGNSALMCQNNSARVCPASNVQVCQGSSVGSSADLYLGARCALVETAGRFSGSFCAIQ